MIAKVDPLPISEVIFSTPSCSPIILVETDSPYLAPIPHRGKPCQPAYVADTLAYLANLKGKSIEEMTEITTRNFFELFQKAEAPQ